MKKILLLLLICITGCSEEIKMIDLTGKTVAEITDFTVDNNITLNVVEEYSSYDFNLIFEQSITPGTILKENATIDIKVSRGIDYVNLKVNELGRIPVMMYHGIYDKVNEYTGGNVDPSGYHRTAKAFREDLEFYYKSGYRMIRLEDYVLGKIDVEAGYSPIVLTFDDGLTNNFNVLGLDEDGDLIIDPDSAIGILEEFKTKYPDFNVTATFFLNRSLFNQSQYNEKILTWLIENGYDIGNHSYTHADLSNISTIEVQEEIGKQYDLFEQHIKDNYVNIIALPFGKPYNFDDPNFSYILNANYQDKNYETVATLRVGWEADYSPFSSSFNQKFIKRIRAYDNNGLDFDIAYNFKILENNKYISDGNIDTIAVSLSDELNVVNNYNLEIITY